MNISHSRTQTYTQRHTHTCTHTHTFSDAIYITDMQQTYIKDITVNCKDIILRSLLWKRLLDSGNSMNLSENGDQGNKVNDKEV